MDKFFAKSADEVFSCFQTTSNGLKSQAERQLRLAKYGKNELQTDKKTNLFAKLLSQFKDVMVIILLIAAVVSLFFGVKNNSSSEIVDAVVIFAIVIINATLGFSQEIKAENALENLKKMAQPYSTILLAGEEEKVKTCDLVPGDIVVLESGDIVPCDMFLIEANSLKCDESALTGESQSVRKVACSHLNENTPLAERKNMCFSSTTVVLGRGKGVVTSTGQETEMGKIAGMLVKNKKELTPLQKSLNKLGEIITFVVLAFAIVIFLVDVIFAHHSYVESFLTAVAIAVGAIPEGLPTAVTIILSIGVTRLAKKNAIIKKLHAVETLGCCQVICSDKTGTITQNKMTVVNAFCDGTQWGNNLGLTGDYLLKCITLCNDAKVKKDKNFGDPTEVALINFADKNGFSKSKLDKTILRVDEIPFDSNRKMMTTLNNDDGSLVQFTKGGVDEVLSCCKFIMKNGEVKPLLNEDVATIKRQNSFMAGKAQRVLAFAMKNISTKSEMSEKDLVFLGLCGMIDPPRDEVFEALKKCKKAGLKAVMITGDHKETATAIALELGMIKSANEVLNGKELDKYSDKELAKNIDKWKVFARVSPEHKVRIVKALQKSGKIVAMTGDGVNDAPSVKSANIGIGMGKNGTEVTKSVADMILTDDNFATIIVAVEEGRNIFNNIQKTIQFLLSCNISEVLTIFALTMLFPQYIFLNAVQILFINLVTDTFPAIALGMDRPSPDIMSQPPRNPNKYIIAGRVGFDIIYQGVAQTLLAISSYLVGLYGFNSAQIATTMLFFTMNMLQLFHMYNVRSNKSLLDSKPFDNKLLNFAFLVETAFLVCVAITPVFANLVGLVHLNVAQTAVVVLCSFAIIPICEIFKTFENKKSFFKNKNNNNI